MQELNDIQVQEPKEESTGEINFNEELALELSILNREREEVKDRVEELEFINRELTLNSKELENKVETLQKKLSSHDEKSMKVDVHEDGSDEKKTGVSILNDFVDIQDNKEVENLKNLIEEYKSDISQKNQTITSLREEITQRGNSSENTQKIQYDFLGEYKAHRVKLMSQLKSHRDQSEKQTEINKILEKEKQIIEKENDILEKEKLLLEDKIKFYEEEITKVHKEQKKII